MMLSIAACSALYYPQDMVITESHYSDAQKLAEVCGDALACAVIVGNSCHIHLPLAANGDAMYREHELNHCAGKLDAPQVGG